MFLGRLHLHQKRWSRSVDSMSMSANLCPFGRRQNHWGLATSGRRREIDTKPERQHSDMRIHHQSISVHQSTFKDWFKLSFEIHCLTKEDQTLATKPCLQDFSENEPEGYLSWKFLSAAPFESLWSLSFLVVSHCSTGVKSVLFPSYHHSRPNVRTLEPSSVVPGGNCSMAALMPSLRSFKSFFRFFFPKKLRLGRDSKIRIFRIRKLSLEATRGQGSGRFLPRLCAHERKVLEVGCSGLGRGPSTPMHFRGE